MCPAFLLRAEESKIWHSHSLGICDGEHFILSYWFLLIFFGHFVKVEEIFNEPQDSLLWCKGSLVIAAPSPPQQVSPLLTSPKMVLISLACPVLQKKNKTRCTLQLHTKGASLDFCEGIRRAVELWFHVLFYSRLLTKHLKTVDGKSCRHIVVTMTCPPFQTRTTIPAAQPQ